MCRHVDDKKKVDRFNPRTMARRSGRHCAFWLRPRRG